MIVYVTIKMDRHTPDRFDNFEKEIRSVDEVMECSIVTGQTADYLIRIMAKNMHHYEHILLNQLTKVNGVRGLHSSFVLRRVVDKTELPLADI